MEHQTMKAYIDQMEYRLLMSDIMAYNYSGAEFDRYFPSNTMVEQCGNKTPSDDFYRSLSEIQDIFSEPAPSVYNMMDDHECLSTPTHELLTPQFGYNSLSTADTLYNFSTDGFPADAPHSPAESSTSEASSETESTGTPAVIRSRTGNQTQAKAKNYARRTNKRKKGKLWEFLLEILMSKETNPSIVKWEDESNGVFRILDCNRVASMWGKRKSNPSMTYEKLSRALRYYYDLNILVKIEGHKLLYRFGDLSLA